MAAPARLRPAAAPALAYLALTVAVAVAVIGPGNLAWDSGFVSWSAPVHGPVPPGDHLQASYYLWLWEHSLTTLDHLPWLDPFQFAATGHLTHQPFGWPLVLVTLPVGLLFGPVVAYNAVVVAGFVLAAWAAAALARVLGGSPAAAAVAGVAFAAAPFRVVQASAHFNAHLAFLLPLLVACVELALQRRSRRWGWAAAAVHASIVASGELHLAVFASLLLGGWLAVRLPGHPVRDLRPLLAPAVGLVALSGAAAAAIFLLVLDPSVAGSGRSAAEAAAFAPRVADLTRAQVSWDRLERFAYPGAAIAVLAVAGAAAALAAHASRRAAAALVALAAAGLALALAPGAEASAVSRAYRVIPFLGFSRVPGRALVLTAMALAVLGGLALDRIRAPRLRWALAGVALVAMVADAPAVFRVNAAGDAALASVPRGSTVLHLPPLDPGSYGGSVYSFALTRHPHRSVGGYSPFVTPAARDAQEAARQFDDLPLDPCRLERLSRRFGLDHVVVHRSLYGPAAWQWPGDGSAVADALSRAPGLEVRRDEDATVVLAIDADALDCPG